MNGYAPNHEKPFVDPTCRHIAATAHAKLAVEVAEPKRTASKVVVKLTMKNQFEEKVISACATAFLMHGQGKVASRETQWIIGGTKDRRELKPDASGTYNFVITTKGRSPSATGSLLSNKRRLGPQ